MVSSLTHLLFCLFLPLLTHSLPLKSSRQYLPPIPGYIPVYIQDGDEPPDVESFVKQQSLQDIVLNNAEVDKLESRNVEDLLRDSKVEIVQQLTNGPSINVHNARVFPNVPGRKVNRNGHHDMVVYDLRKESNFADKLS